jgi:dTDP-4-amino-4,6-dideoxygalactose transaminase
LAVLTLRRAIIVRLMSEENDMTKRMNIPFSPPDISDAEVEEVAKALKSGWITTGPRVKQLEKKIAEYIGVPTEAPNCVCLNSQTACAELALRLLGVGEGDEVIVPAYTYTASASVIVHVGAKIVMVDCQKDSLEMDYDAVEKAINEHTKAIIPVSLGGVPCDYDRLFEIVDKKKNLFKPSNNIQKALGRIALCEDTAHAFGASKNGVMLGNICDFSSFSFHAVKNFTTAEGGCLTWKHIGGIDDAEIYHQLQLLSLHGQSKDALKKNQPGMWEYDIVGTWYKCNMTDIMGAIGLIQFNRYRGMLKRRREIIEKYDASFKPLGVQVLDHYSDDHTSSGHLYITRVFKKDGTPITDQERREIIIKMAEAGVACNVHYKPLPMHTAYKQLGFDIKDYPNAYAHYENEITLPLHTCLKDDEVDYIIETFTKVLKEYV